MEIEKSMVICICCGNSWIVESVMIKKHHHHEPFKVLAKDVEKACKVDEFMAT